MDLHIRRQHGAVQLRCLRLHGLEDVLGLLAPQHQDHALNRVIVLHVAELAQARRVPYRDVTNVFNADGNSVVTAHDDIANVFGVSYQPQTAHVIELSALLVESAARVGVIRSQCIDDLRHGEVIPIEAGGIKQHLILHHRTAEAGVVGHALDGAIFALNHPVFEGLQFLGCAIGAFKNVAIDQAAGAEQRRHGRDHSGRELGLRYPLEDDLPGEIVVCAIVEGQGDVGEAVERNGAHEDDAGHAIEFQLERKRDQSFDFLGGMPRPLCDQLDLRRREVRIGVYRHPLEGDDPGDQYESRQHQHQKALPERRLYDSMDHSGVDAMLGIVQIRFCYALQHGLKTAGDATVAVRITSAAG